MFMDSIKKNNIIFCFLLVLLLAGLCFSLIDPCPLYEFILPALKINKTTIVDFITSLGVWGPLASIGLMVVHSFVPFPSELLTIANGLLFGTFWGVVITWLGAMAGAYASFGLTRLYGRPFVARKVNSANLAKIDLWVQRQGAVSLLLCRFIPLISFNLINYGAGLTKISWWTFTWTTGIGILPVTIAVVSMGVNLHMLSWWVWLLLLLAIIGIAYGVSFLARKHKDSKV